MEKMSRATAARNFARRYFTGKPCPAGHVAERYTSCGVCVECVAPPRAHPSIRKHKSTWHVRIPGAPEAVEPQLKSLGWFVYGRSWQMSNGAHTYKLGVPLWAGSAAAIAATGVAMGWWKAQG